MSTYAHRALHVRRPHINLWLAAVVGLSAALVGLGSWALVDQFGNTPRETRRR